MSAEVCWIRDFSDRVFVDTYDTLIASNCLPRIFPPPLDITAETLAEILGEDIPKPSELESLDEQTEIQPGRIPRDDEADRRTWIKIAMDILDNRHRYTEERKYSVLCEFAAKYLIKLFERYLDPPTLESLPEDSQVRMELLLFNAYTPMICHLEDTKYFNKYFTSQAACTAQQRRRIPGVIASRLVMIAPFWELALRMGYRRALDSACQPVYILTNSVVGASKERDRREAIPEEILKELKPVLENWARFHGDHDIGKASQAVLRLLFEDGYKLEHGVRDTRRMIKGDVCALPGCHARENLKTCARCQTVKYCSANHQRQHWNYPFRSWLEPEDHGHKGFCFKTEY